MSTNLSIPSDDPLVLEIKSEAAKADKRARETVASFRKLGELLIQLKNRVPHGSFMSEVEKLTGIPHRSASRYMGMVHEKPSRKRLADAPAEAYLRKCLNVHVVEPEIQIGQVAILPTPPSPSKYDLPLGATYQDAEIVEPEPEPLVVDGTRAAPDFKGTFDLFSKKEPTPANPSGMARDFIATLKHLTAWEDRQALCDVRDACNRRLEELDKLNGKQKS